MIRTGEYINRYKFSPEMEFLCICSQKSVSDRDKKTMIELMDQPFDWEMLYRLAKKHKLYPTAYKNLTGIEGICKNKHTLAALKQLSEKNLMNSLKLTKELVSITTAFKEQNINMIAIKGPALAMYIYESVSERVSRDLDVLIDKKNLDQAADILFDLGYVPEKSMVNISQKQRNYIINKTHHLGYVNDENVMIELHWKFEDANNRFNFSKVWAGTYTVNMFGEEIHVLAPDENFLFLASHGSRHAWSQLRWLNDIAELIKFGRLDWEYIINESRRRGEEYILAQTLILCYAMYGTDLYLKLRKRIREIPLAQKLSALCIPFFESVDEGEEKYSHALYLKSKIYLFLWNCNLRRRHLYFMTLITPSLNEFNSYNFPDRLFFLYYFVRPYNIIKRFYTDKMKQIFKYTRYSYFQE